MPLIEDSTFAPPVAVDRPPQTRSVALYLFAALLVLFCHLPRLLIQSRIYAEEGTAYLRYAWNATPVHALLAPHQGYYSLLDNVCALIAARLLPLCFSPGQPTAVQLLLICLTVECEVFRTPLQRSLALFAVLLVTPNFEPWLSLENWQSILATAAAVILISSTRRLFALRAATLAFGAFTSVTSAPLVLLFWLRAWRERTRPAVVLAVSITLPALVQGAVLLNAIPARIATCRNRKLSTLARGPNHCSLWLAYAHRNLPLLSHAPRSKRLSSVAPSGPSLAVG